MKTGIFATLCIAAMLLLGCSKNESNQSESDQGTPIDSSVVGKDTSSFDTRKDIEQSDEQKLTNPGRDTTNSDEPRR
ncbi:hypothetical protein [Dyadobacter sp. CY323]|uniref:hypothetical protein n=1 Tax=Dyadobacter sp. CY323 TaxID=2907302 RepID=UPI001F39D59D|nr:hypothetical protein [Dyadobacter sp. CY323]MCE6992961.1 hypothetical protein [Dyadobacter sp. CY323]